MLWSCQVTCAGTEIRKDVSRVEDKDYKLTAFHWLILGKRKKEAKKQKNVVDIFFIGIYE